MNQERYENEDNNPSRLGLIPRVHVLTGRLLCNKQKLVCPHPSFSFHLTPPLLSAEYLSPFVSPCFLPIESSHSLYYSHILIQSYVPRSRCTDMAPVTSGTATARTTMLVWTNTTIGWNVRPALEHFRPSVAVSSTWMRLVTGHQSLNVKPVPVPSLRRLLQINI